MSDVLVLVLKVLASLSALYMCFSPTSSIYRIHKHQDVGQASIVPLVALWACNHMWMLYGYVTNNTFPLLVTYALGDIASIAFIAVYLRYAPDRTFVVKNIAFVAICNALAVVYAVLGMQSLTGQSADSVIQTMGYIAIASSIVLYGSPFSAIKHVIDTKSSSAIPITMVAVGVVNNALWIIYGFLISDMVLVVPTCISVTLGIVQAVLYIVYHPSRQVDEATLTADGLVFPVTATTIESSKYRCEAPYMAVQTPKAGHEVAVSNEVELTKITIQSPRTQDHLEVMSAMV